MKYIILSSFLLVSMNVLAQKSATKKTNKNHYKQKVSYKTKQEKQLSQFVVNLVAYTAVNDEHPIGEASTESETLFSKYGIKFICVKFTPSTERCVFNYTDKITNGQSGEIGVGDSFFTMYSPIKKVKVEAKYLSTIINKNYPLQSKTRIEFTIYELE